MKQDSLVFVKRQELELKDHLIAAQDQALAASNQLIALQALQITSLKGALDTARILLSIR